MEGVRRSVCDVIVWWVSREERRGQRKSSKAQITGTNADCFAFSPFLAFKYCFLGSSRFVVCCFCCFYICYCVCSVAVNSSRLWS